MKLSEMTDRQILIHLIHKVHGQDEKLKHIDKKLSNHLVHVWALVAVLVGVIAAAVCSLLIRSL